MSDLQLDIELSKAYAIAMILGDTSNPVRRMVVPASTLLPGDTVVTAPLNTQGNPICLPGARVTEPGVFTRPGTPAGCVEIALHGYDFDTLRNFSRTATLADNFTIDRANLTLFGPED